MSKKNKNRQQNSTPIPLEVSEENSYVFETPQEDNTSDENEVSSSTVLVEEPIYEEEPSLPKVEEPIPEVKVDIATPVKEEKKEEIKSIEPKQKGVLIVEKKKVATVKPVAKPVNQAVEKFNNLADAYLNIMQKNIISEEDRRKAVNSLALIAQYVLSSTDTSVFDAMFKFMLKNRKIMLVPEVVMNGFYKYCDKTKITRIVQFYVTFQSLVQSQLLNDRFTLNVTTIRRTLNNDTLANWLILKRK